MADGARRQQCWAAALVLVVLGCAEGGGQRAAGLERGRAALVGGRASEALATARGLLSEARTDAGAALLAADACLALGRLGESIGHAQKGLAWTSDEDLRAELRAAAGAAYMERYGELADEDDWRAANAALEHATRAGGRAADAAYGLVHLQDLGSHRDDARRRRFARLFLELEPDSTRAAEVRQLLAAAVAGP